LTVLRIARELNDEVSDEKKNCGVRMRTYRNYSADFAKCERASFDIPMSRPARWEYQPLKKWFVRLIRKLYQCTNPENATFRSVMIRVAGSTN